MFKYVSAALDTLLKVLSIFSIVCISTTFARNDGCKLEVYNEENFKGFHNTLYHSRIVSSIEMKSFAVHGPCEWLIYRIVKEE